jgi:GNAT superfamily N-acetyltransferase
LIELYKHLHQKDDPEPPNVKLYEVWEEIVTNHALPYFGIDFQGQLVSSCALAIIPNLTRGARPYGLIENVVTHTAYRKRGFATKMLKETMQYAWNHDCYKVMLLTGSKDPAIHQFYENTGLIKGIKTGFIAYLPK